MAGIDASQLIDVELVIPRLLEPLLGLQVCGCSGHFGSLRHKVQASGLMLHLRLFDHARDGWQKGHTLLLLFVIQWLENA